MSNTKNIMIVGVGGQGTLLASRILGGAVIRMGHDVKVSEVHGMSQRGGSVVTYVKYGEKVHSPIIGDGEADIVLAFELLEAYRALPALKTGGRLVVNASTQVPYHLRRIVSWVCGIPENKIHIIKERVGGGYGSKQDILVEELTAYAAWKTGKPVYFD